MIFAALLLAGVIGNGADEALAVLNHTTWADIGPGRSYAQLKPAEVARLRKCTTAAKYFEHWEGRPFDEVFLAGIGMRNSFARIDLAQSGGTKVVTLYRDAKSSKPTETLWLTDNASVLTQVIPPAGPHVFVRCANTLDRSSETFSRFGQSRKLLRKFQTDFVP